MAKKDKKQTPGTPETPVLYQNLIVQQARVETADIETWRSAVNLAKQGSRTKLYNLYDNLLADAFLSDALDKRTGAITNTELAFIRNGETVEQIDDLIDTPEFEELLREIMLSRAWGKSVIEIMFNPRFDIFSYPRKHIRIKNLDKPLAEHVKYLAAKEHDMSGYDYVNDARFIECGGDYDLGFLFKAAPYVIYKRGGFGDWAQFVEIFGMPFLIGKYNAFDTASRDRLFEALEKLGSNPRAAIPKEADIDFKETKSNGSSALYREFRQACNEEILISVVGNTMTTINGSSRSQSEVHQQTEEKINQSDRRFVQRTLNRYLIPMLVDRGYDVAGGYFVFPDAGENMSMQERINLALQIRREGIPVSDDYVYDLTGIPKPETGKEKKPEGEEKKPPEKKDVKNTDTAEETPPVVLDLEPFAEPERGFFRKLIDFFADAPATWNGAIRNFGRKSNGSITLAEGDIAVNIDIASLFNQALKEIYGNVDNEPAVEKHLFEITDSALQNGIGKTFAKAGMEFGKKNEAFINEFKYNASVFSAFKNHQQTKELVSLLTDEDGNLRSFAKFKKLAGEVSKDYNQTWLQTEYNTAVRSARSAVNWKKFEEAKDLYPNLEYIQSTAHAKRVLHLEWAGTILPIGHPWWNTHMPPSDWNCQCSVRQTDKAETTVPESGAGNPIFSNNPGKTADFINLKEHPYVKGECPYVNDCSRKDIKSTWRPVRQACEVCLFAKQYHINKQRIAENQKEYDRLKDDKNYYDVKFNPKTGGLQATHKDHQFDKNRGKYEKDATAVLYNYGMKVVLESEQAAKGIKTPDGLLNDIVFDIKSIEGNGLNNIKHKLQEAQAQGVKTIVLYYHEKNLFSIELIQRGYGKYRGAARHDGIENILYIVDGKLYRFK